MLCQCLLQPAVLCVHPASQSKAPREHQSRTDVCRDRRGLHRRASSHGPAQLPLRDSVPVPNCPRAAWKEAPCPLWGAEARLVGIYLWAWQTEAASSLLLSSQSATSNRTLLWQEECTERHSPHRSTQHFSFKL